MRRIVIADASPMFRDAAAHLISSLPGYTLAGTSTTSQQTLSLVDSAGPDILLVDLGTVCGLETVRRVKAAARPPRVVAMTLFHTPQAAAAAARAGADALIGKERFVVGLRDALARLFP